MIKKLIAVLALALVIAGSGGTKVHADVNNFVINNFGTDYYLTRDDPQGQLHIIEHIQITFTDFNHGILRALPKTYKKHQLQIKVNSVSSTSGAPSKYTTYTNNGNLVLKIGDPNQTVTGVQQYDIDYTISNVIGFYPDHDELYWDINGDQWNQRAESVSVIVHLPDDIRLSSQQPLCYTGATGSTASDCMITADQPIHTVNMYTTKPLADRETATIVIGLQKGYFNPSKWYETLAEYRSQLTAFLVMPVLLGGWSYSRWRKKGRDAKGKGVIIPQYDAPGDMSPAEVAGIMSYSLSNKAITAIIIDLAVKGYIKIIETKVVKRLAKDKLEYSFELVKADDSALDDPAAKLLLAMFPDLTPGSTADTKLLIKNEIYKPIANIKTDVPKKLAVDGYFLSSPTKAATSIWVAIGLVGMFSFVFGGLIGAAYILGTVVAVIISVVFAILMPARTEKGALAKEHAEGLMLYLNTAEKDRIKMMQSPDSPYSGAGPAPKKTVNLFEKLLPYAIVLGVENEWAKQFEHIYTEPPNWYSGNWAAFNAIYLTNSINTSMNASMAGAFASPSSSGSSGFGGGGFSGGGGGGGGGGGW